MSHSPSDLVVLVADKNMEAAVGGLLSRPQALGMRPIQFDVYIHPYRDPGCFDSGHDFLRPFTRQYAHGLLMFDRVGSGQDQRSGVELETETQRRLSSNGWDDRADAIVLDPELEVWVWSDSPHVDRCLGWEGRSPDLRTWLRDQSLWQRSTAKPSDPKTAVESALRLVRKPRSSSIYADLANSVSVQRCKDTAFMKFRQTLAGWFPSTSSY